jgi:FkbM family methyltransferase
MLACLASIHYFPRIPFHEAVMSLIVDAARWFNYRFPAHQIKPSLAKRVRDLLDTTRGRANYAGIQGGLRMGLDLAIPHERDIYLNVSNMAMASAFRKILRPGDVAVDGGANLGYLSLIAWQCVGDRGKVYAFEPQPSTRELLAHNVKLNHADNIVIVPKALWYEAGTAQLFDFADSNHDLPSLGQRPDKTVERAYQVETVRMDDIVSEPVRLYKLDIEGAEWPAMRGSERILFSDPPPHVIIELTPRTCEGFGHHSLQVLDWVLERAPKRRLFLIKRRRWVRVKRKDLEELFKRRPKGAHNVWFRPD